MLSMRIIQLGEAVISPEEWMKIPTAAMMRLPMTFVKEILAQNIKASNARSILPEGIAIG
jgi:hypothetical protein